MEPTEILLTIRAFFEFATTLLKWLMTDEGKRFANQALQDRAAWDRFWGDFSSGARKLFKGELWA